MAIYIIFGVGIFVFMMTCAGIFFTITKMRHLDNQSQNYRPKSDEVFPK